MSDVTRTIITAIKTELGSTLTGFKEIPFVNDPSRNSNRLGNSYGVRAGPVREVSGVTRFITYTETFELVLCGTYGSERVGDSAATEKALDLSQAVKQAHAQLIRTKCGAPGSVMNVTALSISSPEYNTEEKTVVVRGTLDVTYRVQI